MLDRAFLGIGAGDDGGEEYDIIHKVYRVLEQIQLGEDVGQCEHCRRGCLIVVDKAKTPAGVWLATICDTCGMGIRYGNPAPWPDNETTRGKQSRAHEAPGGAESRKVAETWHDVLQVSPTATWEEIKAAHRERTKEYHPDRLETHGAELRALAQRKMKEINAAYEQACAARGR